MSKSEVIAPCGQGKYNEEMVRYFLSTITILLAVLLAAGGGWLWRSFSHGGGAQFSLRLPEEKRQISGGDAALPLVGKLVTNDAKQPDPAPDSDTGKPRPGTVWPQFRGTQFDAIAHDTQPLLRNWPKAGPTVRWSKTLGEGHAGAAVRNQRVYLLDYDREHERDVMRCFALDDGRELWNYSYPVRIKRNHGMSRTVPVVTDRFVVGLGPKCHLFCLDAISGKPYWLKDMVKEFGVTIPAWYAGQCPILDADGNLIIATGSDDSLLVALNTESGEVLWKSPNPRSWKMTHVSIVPMQFAGRDLYVYCGKGGVAGIDAKDGSLLWDTTDWKINIATVPSPVPLPDGRIFCSGGYNSGAVMLKLKEMPEGKIGVETLYRLKPKQFGSAQHTPIFYKDHLFGVRERDKQLVCLDLDGNEVWRSGSENKFGIGPYLIADDLIWVLEDSGKLTIAEATPEAYRPIAEAQVLDGHDAWAPMAMADGFLFLRDLTQFLCLDVRAKQGE